MILSEVEISYLKAEISVSKNCPCTNKWYKIKKTVDLLLIIFNISIVNSNFTLFFQVLFHKFCPKSYQILLLSS